MATLQEAWTSTGVLDTVSGGQVLGGTSQFASLPPAGMAVVTSIDVMTGARNWSHDLITDVAPGYVIHPPVLVEGQVWTGWSQVSRGPGGWQCGGGFVKLDPETGSREFTWPDQPTALVPYGEALAAAFRPCHSLPSGLVVLDPSQPLSILWRGPAGAQVGRPVLVGELLLTSDAAMLHAFPAAGCGAPECAPLWTVDLGRVVRAVAAGPDGQAVVLAGPADGPTEMLVVDAVDGSVVWQAVTGGAGAELAVGGDTVYVAGGDQVQAYDAAGCGATTCEPVWTAALPSPVSANLAIAGGVVYAASSDGTVTARAAAGCGATTCEPIAQVSVPGQPTDLVVSNGRLLVGQGRGVTAVITAFAPS